VKKRKTRMWMRLTERAREFILLVIIFLLLLFFSKCSAGSTITTAK